MLGKCYRYSHEIAIRWSAPRFDVIHNHRSPLLPPSFSHSSLDVAAAVSRRFRVFSTRDNQARGNWKPIIQPAEATNFGDCTYLLTLRSLSLSSPPSTISFFSLRRSYVLKCIIITVASFDDLQPRRGNEIAHRYVNYYT